MIAPIAPDDRGFTLGDGLFETVLSEAGELVDWPAHVRRLSEGCVALGLPVPEEGRLASHARQALYAASLREVRAAVRITWTAGRAGRGLERPEELEPTLSVTAAPSPPPPPPARLVTVHLRRNETSLTSRHKTLSYVDNVMARRQAVEAGGDEALMLNTRGEVACASVANLFWVKGEVLYTPVLECGVLAGVVRARVIELAPEFGLLAREVRASRPSLGDAEAIFLTNSLMGARPVASLDGQPLPQQVEHSILNDLLGRK